MALPRTLILFDVDGTLLSPDGCGRAAVAAAVRELFGLDLFSFPLDFAGKTDWQILLEILTPLGHTPEAVAAALPAFARVVAGHLQAGIHRHDVRPLPGALELIRDLRGDPRACLGLVTGNVATTAPIKLRAAGFDPECFAVGAYGHEGVSRNDLPPLALQRAVRHWRTPFPPGRIVVVGDTPADVVCARSVGGRAIAVLTGWVGQEELEAVRPYALVEDLTDHDRLKTIFFDEG